MLPRPCFVVVGARLQWIQRRWRSCSVRVNSVVARRSVDCSGCFVGLARAWVEVFLVRQIYLEFSWVRVGVGTLRNITPHSILASKLLCFLETRVFVVTECSALLSGCEKGWSVRWITATCKGARNVVVLSSLRHSSMNIKVRKILLPYWGLHLVSSHGRKRLATLTLVEVGVLLRLIKCIYVKAALVIKPSTLCSLLLIGVQWEWVKNPNGNLSLKFKSICLLFVLFFLTLGLPPFPKLSLSPVLRAPQKNRPPDLACFFSFSRLLSTAENLSLFPPKSMS